MKDKISRFWLILCTDTVPFCKKHSISTGGVWCYKALSSAGIKKWFTSADIEVKVGQSPEYNGWKAQGKISHASLNHSAYSFYWVVLLSVQTLKANMRVWGSARITFNLRALTPVRSELLCMPGYKAAVTPGHKCLQHCVPFSVTSVGLWGPVVTLLGPGKHKQHTELVSIIKPLPPSAVYWCLVRFDSKFPAMRYVHMEWVGISAWFPDPHPSGSGTFG